MGRMLTALCCCVPLAVAQLGATAAAAEIKVATIAPDGSHWMKEMRAGARLIKQMTGGRVEMKFYPGGIMGGDAQVLRKIRIGQLQGGAFTSGGLAARYNGLNIYGIPLMFRSLDEVDYVRKRLDPKIAAGLRKAGFVSFGFVEGGFANLLSKEPIRSIDDLRRKKVWVPEGDHISYLAMQAVGLSPVVLPVTDVLTGLETGLISVTAASPVATLVLQWHTKVKYMTELPVSYSMGVFAISAKTFMSLSPADRKVVRDVMTRVMHGLDRDARKDNADARKVLYQSGIQPVHVAPAHVEEIRRSVQRIYPELRQRPEINGPLFDQLLALLKQYRSAHNEKTAP